MFENFSEHTYVLASENKEMKTKYFNSRQAANEAMYSFVGKHHLQLEEVYDDKHCKTYIFTNGTRIHINRE